MPNMKTARSSKLARTHKTQPQFNQDEPIPYALVDLDAPIPYALAPQPVTAE
jgi:hypothetical protein